MSTKIVSAVDLSSRAYRAQMDRRFIEQLGRETEELLRIVAEFGHPGYWMGVDSRVRLAASLELKRREQLDL